MLFDKPCTVTALPDNRCSQECNNALVLCVHLQSGMGTSKTNEPRFHVPGSMQIVGPNFEWKDHLVVQTDTRMQLPICRDDTGDTAHFPQALQSYGSSWQLMFTRMQQDMDVTFHS